MKLILRKEPTFCQTLVALQNDIRGMSAYMSQTQVVGCSKFLPSQRHFPDLEPYQNGIALLNPQTSFHRETSVSAKFSDYLKC